MGPLVYWTRSALVAFSPGSVHKLVLYIAMSICLVSLSGCQVNPSSDTHQNTQAKQRTAIDLLFQQIDDDIDAFRLSSPVDNNALAKLASIKQSDPDNPRLIEYQDKIANRYLYLTEAAINRKKWSKANRYLDFAMDINKDIPAIDTLKQSLASAQKMDEKSNSDLTKTNNLTEGQEATPTEPNTPPSTGTSTGTGTALAKLSKGTTSTSLISAEPQEQTIQLNQKQISARSTFVSLSLEGASQKIINNNATVTIFTQSMRDYRWLSALLKTSIYLMDSDFTMRSESRIDKSSEPKLVLKPNL